MNGICEARCNIFSLSHSHNLRGFSYFSFSAFYDILKHFDGAKKSGDWLLF